MKALVVYDSFFGNTERIANAISNGIGRAPDVRALRVKDVKPEHLEGLELLVVGSPTRGFRPSPDTVAFLNSLPANGLRGVRVAAFDTRIAMDNIKSGFFRFIVNTGGYAAKPIADRLVKKGGMMKVMPEGFLVVDKEGPLVDGEPERAVKWGSSLLPA